MGRERGELLKPQHSCCCNLPIIKRHRRQTRDRTNPTRRPPTAMATRQPAVPDYVTVRPYLHQRLPATAPALAFRRLDLTIVKRECFPVIVRRTDFRPMCPLLVRLYCV